MFDRIRLSFNGLSLRFGEDCDETEDSELGISLGLTASMPDAEGGSGKRESSFMMGAER